MSFVPSQHTHDATVGPDRVLQNRQGLHFLKMYNLPLVANYWSKDPHVASRVHLVPLELPDLGNSSTNLISISLFNIRTVLVCYTNFTWWFFLFVCFIEILEKMYFNFSSPPWCRPDWSAVSVCTVWPVFPQWKSLRLELYFFFYQASEVPRKSVDS